MITESRRQQIKSQLKLPKYREAYRLLAVISGSMRVRIITALYLHRPGLTVTTLAKVLDASVSRVSHQLRILRKNDIVEVKRVGRIAVYKLRLAHMLRRVVKP